MAQLLPATWTPDPDAYGPRRHRKPCAYEAYVPDDMASLPLDLAPDLYADLVDAQVELTAFDHESELKLEHLARFLLRAEAVASSHIEGLTVGPRRLARYEAARDSAQLKPDHIAEEVLGNVAAMRAAITTISSSRSISPRSIDALHSAILGVGSPHAGRIRSEQNWIGGSGFGPCDADFVPPPPHLVPAMIIDLCKFANRDDIPAALQAGLVHAQFETIHPYADGNGRTGRALIHVILKRRDAARNFVPPVSLALAAQARSYVAALGTFRYVGSPTSSSAHEGVSQWLDFFIATLRRSVADARHLARELSHLEAQWREAVRPRGGSAAAKLIPLLATHPVITVAQAATLTATSYPAANAALSRLVDAGVLHPSPAARNRVFEALDVFTLMTQYERAAATPGGDTRVAKPQRQVPGRR